MPKKQLKGTVISDKMQKTIVVRVEAIKVHSKYQKRYKSHKNFKADNSSGEYHTGDRVIIGEATPQSRDKKWIVVEKM